METPFPLEPSSKPSPSASPGEGLEAGPLSQGDTIAPGSGKLLCMWKLTGPQFPPLTAALHPQVPLCCPDLGRGEEVLSPGRVQPPAGLRPRGSSQGTAVLWTVRAHSLPPAGEESDRGLAEGSWLPPRDVRCLRPAPPSNGVLLGVTKRSHPQPGMSSPSQIPIETGSRSQSGPQEAFPRIGAGVGELFMKESGREI